MPCPALALAPAPAGAEALAALLAYLVGAIPFGLVLVRLFAGVDLRTVGSGNIGTTNAMRAGGRPLGLAVFALDFLKGWVAPFAIAPGLDRPGGVDLLTLQVACGAAAVLGHCFPVYLGFRGGKGVATGCGALVALDPSIFLVGGAVWVLVLALTRFAGLASIAMGCAFALAAWYRWGPEQPQVVVGAALLLVLILVRHRSNISRMLAGTEPKVFARRAGARRDEA